MAVDYDKLAQKYGGTVAGPPPRPSRLEGNVRGLASMIPPVSAGVGGILGAIGGAPAAGIGAIPGAAMGATAGGVVGKTGEDLLLRALGMDPEPGMLARFTGAQPGGQAASGLNALQEGGMNAALGLIPGIPGMARGAARGTAGAASKVASAPILRHLPGASITRRVAGDVGKMADDSIRFPRIAEDVVKPPTAAAVRATEKAAKAGAEKAATARVASGKAAGMTAKPPARSPEVEARIKELASKPNVTKRIATEAADGDRIAVPAHTRARNGTAAKPEATARPSRPMRAASKPELERRAAAMEKVREAGKPRPSLPKAKADSANLPQNQASPAKPEPMGSRHDVQYWSKSANNGQGQHLTIENMNVPHLRAAITKSTRELAALGKNSDTRAQVKTAALKAMKAEIEHRAKTSGIHGY